MMAVIYAVVVAETAGHHAPMTKRAITIWHVYTALAVSLLNAVYSLSFSNILELSKISRDFYSWKIRVGRHSSALWFVDLASAQSSTYKGEMCYKQIYSYPNLITNGYYISPM